MSNEEIGERIKEIDQHENDIETINQIIKENENRTREKYGKSEKANETPIDKEIKGEQVASELQRRIKEASGDSRESKGGGEKDNRELENKTE